MQDIANIFITFFVCVLVLLVLDRWIPQNEQAVADEPFYIPGFLENKPIEKELRRVSDITTEMLRRERKLCEQLKRIMTTKEYIELYEAKLFPINIRLSIKQTKK